MSVVDIDALAMLFFPSPIKAFPKVHVLAKACFMRMFDFFKMSRNVKHHASSADGLNYVSYYSGYHFFGFQVYSRSWSDSWSCGL